MTYFFSVYFYIEVFIIVILGAKKPLGNASESISK